MSGQIAQLYRHYKGGIYEVLGYPKHTETGEALVYYREYGAVENEWIRPFEMFFSEVEVDGERVQRFAPISPLEVTLPHNPRIQVRISK